MVWGDFFNSSIMDEEIHVRFVFLMCLVWADANGEFRATRQTFARRGNIPQEQADDALEKLQAPDPDSTSKDEDGRRLISIGQNQWRVVNYVLYRRRFMKEESKEAGRFRKLKFDVLNLLEEAGMDRDDGRELIEECAGALLGVSKREDALRIVMERYEALRALPSDIPVSVPVCVSVPVSVPVKEEKKKKRSVFKRPTVEEVAEYLEEKGETRIDPETFVNFYESKGWAVGKSPMKDWRAAVRTWIRQRDADHVKPGGVDMHVGATPKKKDGGADKERKALVQHIMKHANHLLKILPGLTDSQQIIVASSAEEFEALAESGMAKGLMEEKFYTIHDQMMDELLGTITEEEEIGLQVDFPGGGVKWATWAHDRLQSQLGINDPLDYEIGKEDS
jgi:hypothetical protein